MNCRLKLFDSVVSSTMLYGNAAWTLTQPLRQEIRTTQRRMLRMVLGSGRRPMQGDTGEVEPWVDWLKRTTRDIEKRLGELQIPEWLDTHRQTKLKWARQIVTRDEHTWAWRAMLWDPDPWTHRRAHGRPRRRWIDDITDAMKKN